MKKQKHFLLCLVFFLSIVISCVPSPAITPTPSQTALPTETKIPVTPTPTLDFRTIILTPDDIFSLPEIVEWNTPNSGDFCESLPEPQVVRDPNDFYIFSGKFVLCIYERSFMAIDLDEGNLIISDWSIDDEIGDFIMLNGRFGTKEDPDYYIASQKYADLNDAFVIEKYNIHSGKNNLSYNYCKDILQDGGDIGVMDVDLKRIACVKTSEEKIAMLQVEKIYPSITLSVEFSFVVFKGE